MDIEYEQQGSFAEKEMMEKLLREHNIEVVICATGGGNILDQIALIEAIKSVGTIKVNLSNYLFQLFFIFIVISYLGFHWFLLIY